MKKTISLIMVMLLSITIFASDIAGITMVVRASEEYSDEGDDGGDDPTPVVTEVPDPDPDPDPTEIPDPDPDPDPDPNPDPDPTPVVDPAAEEAARKAEEEAEAARKAAEDAAKKAAQEAANDYSLIVTMNGAQIPGVDFGSAPVGQSRDYIDLYVTNTGATSFDLLTTKNSDPDGAFSLTIKGDMVHYEAGDSGKVSISMRSDLPAGDYSACFLFGAKSDPSFSKAVAVQARGTVVPGAGVTSVQVSPSHVVVAKGSTWDFSADVEGTGQFDHSVRWTLTGGTTSSISADGELTVAPDETRSNLTVTATSVADSSKNDSAQVQIQVDGYTVRTKADPDGGGRITGGGHVKPGGSVTLSALPNTNYVFDGWYTEAGRVSTDTNYTISNIQSDMDVVAKFSRNSVTVTLNVNDSDGGKVSGAGKYDYGSTATIKAKAYNGYTFIGWKENGDIVSRDSEVNLKNLTVDRTLKAEFKKSRYTVNLVVNPSNAGDVSGGGSFNLGDSTTIKATPRSGYDFTGWYVNGQVVSRDREYRISKIEQDYTITANFQQQGATTYEISSGVATTGGSISPSGKIYVPKGSSITYTIAPKAGFAILAVAVDDTQVGPISSYTFSNVTGPHKIAAAFVQTDAGKKAAESSGVQAQDTKVKVIPKNESNTATQTSTISINEAANGEGGDNYVEDMDLKDIHVPSDEELGITEEPDNGSDSTGNTDVTRLLGKSLQEVNDMIMSGDTLPVLDAAFCSGHLATHVVNALEPEDLVGVDYNRMTEQELWETPDSEINPSLPNFDVVVQKMLTTDEVSKLAKGDHVDISVSLTGLDNGDDEAKNIMENAVGRKPVKFFDLTMLKTVDGFTQKVTELPTAMEVIIEIPSDVYKAGEKYSILRVHEGELSILPNLSDNPREIKFRTDRFSSYAIAREITSANSIIAWLFAGAALALGVAVTCFLILVAHHRKMRRMKRNAAHAAHH